MPETILIICLSRARSRILEQEEAKDRERYVVKFIKVMKYLRKLNNFNSYLAILSALDSAPIRRLEWQRNITEVFFFFFFRFKSVFYIYLKYAVIVFLLVFVIY